MIENNDSQLSIKTPTINMREEVDSLNQRAWSLSERHPERAVEIAENAGVMSASLKIPYRKGMADSGKALGKSFITLELFESALPHLLDALMLYQRLELVPERTYVMYLIGKLYLDAGDLESARRYLHPAAPLARSLNNLEVEQEILTALGYLYSRSGDNSQSIAYLKQVIDLGENARTLIVAEAYALLCEVTLKLNEPKLALDYG